MRAVLYARYSSNNQRYESITGQIRCSTEYCKQKGYAIVGTYIDEAKSGTTIAGRDNFNKMIEDASGNLFDVVVFYQIDRTARNEMDYYANIAYLLENGIRYEYSAEGGIDTSTANGKLTEGVKVAIAAWYSRDLAVKIKRGKKETALQFKHNGGIPPFGYDVSSDGKYIVNQKEAAAVKHIFQMKANGSNYSEILDYLKNHCFVSKRGTSFCKNSLHDIFRNKKYIGIYEYGKTTKHNSRVKSSDYFACSDVIPSIIDKNTFNVVQELLDARKNGKYSAKEIYALSGRITCSCGSSMRGHRMKKGTNIYCYYVCGNKLSHHSECKEKAIPKDNLEKTIYAVLNDFILQNKKLLFDAFWELAKKHFSKSDIQNVKLQKEIQMLTKKAEGLLTIYDGTDNLLLKKYQETMMNIENLKAKQIIHERNSIKVTPEVINEFIKEIAQPIKLTGQLLMNFFKALNVKVEIKSDSICITSALKIHPFVVALRGIEPLIPP